MKRTIGLLIWLVGVSGCYLSHDRPLPPSGSVVDASVQDASVPDTAVHMDSSARTCVDPAVELVVQLADTCPSEPFVIFIEEIRADGGSLLVEGDTSSSEAPCTFEVASLGEDLASQIADALAGRVLDAYVAASPAGIEVRDTTLCDGPNEEACPLVFAAETGPLPHSAASGNLRLAWGDVLCEGDCGTLRNLRVVVEPEGGEAMVGPGAIGVLGSFRFASLRPWNTCTDAPSIISWALWRP